MSTTRNYLGNHVGRGDRMDGRMGGWEDERMGGWEDGRIYRFGRKKERKS